MRELREVFPGKLRKLWNSMELRVLVLLSLFLQIVLISTGSRRKYIRKKWVGVILWLCYLSADVVATIALGVLSQAAGDGAKSVDQNSYAIMGFWAPFLLMHLGGPDTITAYALADNELWSRHFLGLVGQVSIAIYVLLRSWITTPVNYLWFAIFAAGLFKYGERTVVLFWASRDQFRKWMVSPPDPGPNYAKFMDEFVSKEREGYVVSLEKVVVIDIVPSEPDVVTEDRVQDAYPFFLTFKKLFGDLILSFQDKKTSLSFFRALTWEKAFGIVEIELGFIYDLFYTKATLLYSPDGLSFRILSWLSTVGAFIAFIIIDKSAYPKSEVIITYILLAGAILIEIYAVIIFISSDWYIIWPQLPISEQTPYSTPYSTNTEFMLMSASRYLASALGKFVGKFHIRIHIHIRSWLSYLLPARLRWSNAMGQYNVLDRCIEHKPSKIFLYPKLYSLTATLRKSNATGQYNFLDRSSESEPDTISQYLKEYLFWNGKSVPKGLKASIFDELKRRVGIIDGDEKLGGYRGDRISLQKTGCFEKAGEVEFDQSVLLWHMATDLCYHADVKEENKPPKTWLYEFIIKKESSLQDILKFKREISVLLSNYMVHLLIKSPFMLPSGIGQIRFQDTRAEAREFFDGREDISRSKACEMLLKVDTRLLPSKVKGDRSKSLLFDACRLAKSLQYLGEGERWDKISQAWLDILTFAAAECKWSDHAEKLSQGGELLTHVWLLMAHFGMTDQFQISQGYERVKLNLK